MKKLKRFTIVLLVLLAAFAVYVEIVNRNSKNMTYRQKILKATYPAIMWLNKITGSKSKKMANTQVKAPVTSFYDLKAYSCKLPLVPYKGTINSSITL